MLFSEIYSAYYNAVSALINKAIEGKLNSKTASEIINQKAFSESFIYILDAIKNEQWQVITKDFTTPIRNKTEMPLTTLQLRFLKAISQDKRFKLFAEEIQGIEDIEPLYFKDNIRCFDVFYGGDEYETKEYINTFKTVLFALKNNRRLKIEYDSPKGQKIIHIFTPRKLEYSEKNDKFRLHCTYNNSHTIINIGRIKGIELLQAFNPDSLKAYSRKKKSVLLEIIDKRNAMERCMLGFADFEKVTKSLADNRYQMNLKYNSDDETELLIRILSFGPVIKVLEPESFIDLIKERIEKQKKLQNI